MCSMCKKEVHMEELNSVLSRTVMNKYNSLLFDKMLKQNPQDYSCCPNANCNFTFFYKQDEPAEFHCSKCNGYYCLSCRCRYHNGFTCKEYREKVSFVNTTLLNVSNWIKSLWSSLEG